MREYLESAAHRSEAARKELDGPEYPETIEYLREWTYGLHGRSGVGPDGYALLSYGTIESWARLNDLRLDPMEVSALVLLDSALVSPGAAAEEQQEERAPKAGWPTRAAGVEPVLTTED